MKYKKYIFMLFFTFGFIMIFCGCSNNKTTITNKNNIKAESIQNNTDNNMKDNIFNNKPDNLLFLNNADFEFPYGWIFDTELSNLASSNFYKNENNCLLTVSSFVSNKENHGFETYNEFKKSIKSSYNDLDTKIKIEKTITAQGCDWTYYQTEPIEFSNLGGYFTLNDVFYFNDNNMKTYIIEMYIPEYITEVQYDKCIEDIIYILENSNFYF